MHSSRVPDYIECQNLTLRMQQRPFTRLIGAVLLEQNDEWLLQHRYMQIEKMAELIPPAIDAEPTKLPPKAA